MTDAGDAQDQAESLDDDKLDDGDDYGDEGPVEYPADRSIAVDERPIEPGAAESAVVFTDREEPDPLVLVLDREADELDRAERSPAEAMLDDLDVAVPDEDIPDDVLNEDDELSELDRLVLEDDDDLALDAELDDEGRTVATLIDPTPGYDDEEQAVALEGMGTGDETAEEAAMHIEHER